MPISSSTFDQLCDTVRTLLGEKGCPWDRRQTFQSLKQHLASELEELLIAIDREDSENICEELGDLVYLVLLLSEMSQKNNGFTIEDVLVGINAKLVRRHPHVFENYMELSDEELRKQWLTIKSREKSSE
jgi:uncharacterized protein YabN with tetrapyrrole methylase and pyrophosphatase domain